MNVLISDIDSGNLAGVLKKLHGSSREKRHSIVEDASAADVILICGSWTGTPSSLTTHPLFLAHPQKCAVFSEDDLYLPLLPGVYCSPKKSLNASSGRVRSFSYISRHAGLGNSYVKPLRKDKDLFFSFQGASTSFVRKRLFRMKTERSDALIEDTSAYWHWDSAADRSEAQRRYAETVARSHFVLCPRGAGTGSHRLFEVMSMGVAPVLLADDYPLPQGPDWPSFLIQVPEKQVYELPAVLQRYAHESKVRGCRAREEWLRWFSPEQEFDRIVDACHATLQAPGAKLFQVLRPFMILRHQSWCMVRRSLRSLVLKMFEVLDVPFPFALRGHDR